MESILNDLRYGARMLAARPGFSAIVVLTLALGIGAATAMFSIVNGVLLRPLPYPEPEQLIRIHTQRTGRSFGAISTWEYLDILEGTRSFQAIGLYRFTDINVSDGDGEPEYVRGVRMMPGVLDALGIQPALGRSLGPEEGDSGSHRVVLLSDRLWKRQFGAAPEIVGSTIRVNGESYQTLGARQGFPRNGFPRLGGERACRSGGDFEALPAPDF